MGIGEGKIFRAQLYAVPLWLELRLGLAIENYVSRTVMDHNSSILLVSCDKQNLRLLSNLPSFWDQPHTRHVPWYMVTWHVWLTQPSPNLVNETVTADKTGQIGPHQLVLDLGPACLHYLDHDPQPCSLQIHHFRYPVGQLQVWSCRDRKDCGINESENTNNINVSVQNMYKTTVKNIVCAVGWMKRSLYLY